MDLGLFARVLWRFRWITGCGLVLAVALTALAMVTSGNKQQWVSYQTMLVTQRGFTEGRTDQIGADPSRLTLLAVIYSQFTSADTVTRELWPNGAHDESIQAAPVLELAGSSAASALPIVSIAAFSTSPSKARDLATRAAAALTRFVERRQASNHIPATKRVELQPIATAARNKPKLWKKPSKALPIVIFLTVMIAAIGLAFVLENLRPRIRPLQGEDARFAGTAAS